jgi:beta-N-acetylhexosaminidase
MSLDQKIGQLLMIPFEGDFLSENDRNYKDIVWSIKKYKIGGLILFGGTPHSVAFQLNEFQKLSKIPLLVSSDFERGVFQQLPNGIHFPPNMALGATRNTAFAYEQGEIIAREARAIGVHMLLNPVLDVNNNPKNPIINFRSYGEDATLVSEMGAAFVRGAQKNKVLATAKHFPGHGDTDFDSHLGLPVLDLDSARLDSVELKPFRAAIQSGIAAIMTGHIALPKLHDGKNTPATTSKVLIHDILRSELGFKGLVISDAFNMKGINLEGMSRSAIVDAVNAGVDIILMPVNVHFAFMAIKEAYKKKEISKQTLDAAVRRQLKAKYNLGLARNRYVKLGNLKRKLEKEAAKRKAYTHAFESISWLRNRNFPKRISRQSKLLVISTSSEHSLENAGKSFFSRLKKSYPNAKRLILDHRTDSLLLPRYADEIGKSDIVIAALFSRTRGGNEGHGIGEREKKMLQFLLDRAQIPILIASFGSPYIASDFARYPNHLAAYSYSHLMQIRIQKKKQTKAIKLQKAKTQSLYALFKTRASNNTVLFFLGFF